MIEVPARHPLRRTLLIFAAVACLSGCCAKPLVMPDEGYRATISVPDPPTIMARGEKRRLFINLTNASRIEWQTRGVDQDDPWRGNDTAQYAMFVGNHWLDTSGKVVQNDDGRSQPPERIAPGETYTIKLGIHAPATPGDYILEIDVVQENVTWFSKKGSPTARYNVKVE